MARACRFLEYKSFSARVLQYATNRKIDMQRARIDVMPLIREKEKRVKCSLCAVDDDAHKDRCSVQGLILILWVR